MSAHVKDAIRTFIVHKLLSGDERGLTDDTDLQESGLLDSFNTLELTSFLETTFHIQLDPPDMVPAHFATLGAIARLVEAKTARLTP